MTGFAFLQIVYIGLTNAGRGWSRMRLRSGSEGLIANLHALVIVREWGNRRFHRRGWGRRFLVCGDACASGAEARFKILSVQRRP